MEAVIAGWVAGYAMAILTTAALSYLAIGPGRAAFERFAGSGMAPALVAVPASIGSFLAWTMAGLVLGMIYDLADLSAVPFFIGMVALALMPLPFLLLLSPRQWWLWAGMSGAFVGLFGVLLPFLAAR